MTAPDALEQRILLAIDEKNVKPPQEMLTAAYSGFMMALRSEHRVPVGLVWTVYGPTGELREVLDQMREAQQQEQTPALTAEWDQRYALITEYAEHAGVIVQAFTRPDGRGPQPARPKLWTP